MTAVEILKAIKVARTLGATRFKWGDLEVDFGSPAATLSNGPSPSQESPEAEPTPAESAPPNGRLPTDEEILYMSSPLGPVMTEAGLVQDEPPDEEDRPHEVQ